MRGGFLFLVLSGLSACGATAPGVPPGEGGDAEAGPGPTLDGGIPDEVPVLLAPLPGTTYWDTIPIHGSGPAGGTLLVNTTTEGALTVPIAPTGNFCVDVPLEAETLNTFTLRSVDEEGQLGTEISAQVMQAGDPPPPPAGNPARNIVLGGSLTTSEDVSGSINNVLDGDWSSQTTFTNSWFHEDWVWVLSNERAIVERVVVVSADDCRMSRYNVMFSDIDAPGDPEADNPNWTYTEVSVPWSATELLYEPFVTRHVAIRFISGDCSEWYGRGKHKIREVQAWTQRDVPPPPASAPSCANGG